MTQSNIKLASYFIARSFRRIIICILAVHNYNWRTEHFSLIQDQSGSFSAMAHSSSGSINSSNNMWWCRSFGVFWRQLELHWRCLIGERGRPWPWVWTLAPLILCSRPSVRPTDWWRSVGTLPWHHVPSMPIREVRLWTPNPPRFWGWAAKPDLVILRPPTGRVKWADRHAQSSTWRQPRERPRFHW